MTAEERVLAEFERISEGPDAIAKLRQFVLDLAVRGKLVQQDPEDEPAQTLLARIYATELSPKTLSRRVTSTSDVAVSPAFPLPSGWSWSSLAEIGTIGPRNSAADSSNASFVPMALIPADYRGAAGHEVRKWAEIKKGYTHIADGDVGLAKITPCFENGKAAVFEGLTGGIGSATTELHVVRPVLVSARFILAFLKSPLFVEAGVPQMTGTAGQKRLPLDHFATAPLPLPPLAEQIRIVARVDELMELCDRLEAVQAERERRRDRVVQASLARLSAPSDAPTSHAHARFHLDNLQRLVTTRAHVRRLRGALLDLAAQGRLTQPVGRDDSASVWLERIAAERRELVALGRLPRAKPVERLVPEQPPGDLPDGWSWATIAQATLWTQDGTSERGQGGVGVPVLAMGQIQRGLVILDDAKRIPSAKVPADLMLERFDLLYNRTNSADLVGKTGIYLGESGKRTFASYLIRIRPSLRFSEPRYINLAMNTPAFRASQIVPLIKKQTGQANVSGGALLKMIIPFPPLEEQRRIVAKVDELMSLCDALEVQLDAASTERQRLLDSLLHAVLHADVLGPHTRP